jgi:hypothetical protein
VTSDGPAPGHEREVYTLVVQAGRRPGDGLPDAATGARLLCYVAARSEDEAVRETVAVLRAAEMAPLDVTSYGTLAERRAAGPVAEEETVLIGRAGAENAVIVAEVVSFLDEDGA